MEPNENKDLATKAAEMTTAMMPIAAGGTAMMTVTVIKAQSFEE